MPLREDRRFIPDPRPNMTTEEKNVELSTNLALVPFRTMQIVRIDRIEIGASGWWITYRTLS